MPTKNIFRNEPRRKIFRPLLHTGAPAPRVRHRARLRREPLPHVENQRDAVDGGEPADEHRTASSTILGGKLGELGEVSENWRTPNSYGLYNEHLQTIC